ncbi:hypothetical protein P879_00537 [Paragonimus westermani]|uniref:Biopterin-dependent aromatic amino acid hydroxylase family profile domain-containing protein n=1 Tax=Paragonimus westermani TaxID=34504 RepID=A0A8T0DS85_9TREM|nr:hypothetical protein P879_00537 [Paragonimus westermani]
MGIRIFSLLTAKFLCFSAPVWVPYHVSDLDKCQHLLLKFQPELQTDHPGFHDEAYRKRRQDIAQLAFDYHQ